MEAERKFYVVLETYFDLIIGRKEVNGLDLRVVESIVRIISDNAVRVACIKINGVPSKSDEVATTNISNNGRFREDVINTDCLNALVGYSIPN